MSQAPKLFYQTTEGEYSPLKISVRGRGRVNSVPSTSKISFYKEVMQDGVKAYQATTSFPLPNGADHVLLFLYLDENSKVQSRTYSDSPELHHGGQVRIINLTNQDIACMVNEDKFKLSSGDEIIETVLKNSKKFSFAFAVLEPKPYKSPVKSLPMRTSEHRLIIVFSYLKKPIFNNEGEIDGYALIPDTTRLYDRQ